MIPTPQCLCQLQIGLLNSQQAELILSGIGLLIKHGVDHALAAKMAQGSEEADFAQPNLITLTVVLGTMPPVCLKGSKLLAIAFCANALAADITSDVYDRFRRWSIGMLHGQYLQLRAGGGHPNL
ncbi:hypothetical protein, partial [Pseudomonas putida]|uniref:hypothetical protein n=1 Tax=Pseudomonas putida TaxID=303 RepID=UPI001955BAF9